MKPEALQATLLARLTLLAQKPSETLGLSIKLSIDLRDTLEYVYSPPLWYLTFATLRKGHTAIASTQVDERSST